MRVDIKDLPLNMQKQALRKLAEEEQRQPEVSRRKAKELYCSVWRGSGNELNSNTKDSNGMAMPSYEQQRNGDEQISPSMQSDGTDKNRGAHGDSSFKLGGMPSSSENPLASAMGSVKGSKYHAKKVILPMPDGTDHEFDSRHEANVYGELYLMQMAGEISDLQIQVPYVLIPKQVAPSGKKYRECKYIADFVYKDKDGNTIVVDAKGYKTKDYIIKRKLMLKVWGIEIQEL